MAACVVTAGTSAFATREWRWPFCFFKTESELRLDVGVSAFVFALFVDFEFESSYSSMDPSIAKLSEMRPDTSWPSHGRRGAQQPQTLKLSRTRRLVLWPLSKRRQVESFRRVC